MSTVPPYEHDAHVYRTRDGWQRWHASCPCGWRWTGVGGKEDAERAAREHDGGRLEHSCYDTATCEFDPGPCAACLAEAVDPPSVRREVGEYLAEQPLEVETDEQRTARIHARDRGDSYRRGRSSR